MARQNIIPDPAKRLFDAYMDFSGGLNATVANDKLKDNEFPIMQNVDLSGRGSLKRRYGRLLVAQQAGTAQGIFQFYRQGQSAADIFVAINGQLFVLQNGGSAFTAVSITDGNTAGWTFQTSRPVAGAQYKTTLYVTTGTKLVQVTWNSTNNVFVAQTVVPYTPTVQEAIYIGTNALAPNPNAYIQDGTQASGFSIAGIAPSTQQPYVQETDLQFTAYINKATGVGTLYYNWEYQLSTDTTWTQGNDANGNPVVNFTDTTGKTFPFIPQTPGSYNLRVTIADGALDPVKAPNLATSGTGGTLYNGTNVVAYDIITSNGRSLPSPVASANVASGANITTTITIPTGTTGIGIYCVQNGNVLAKIGDISNTGTITYAGGKTAGLAVTVSGQALAVTISQNASATGDAPKTTSTAYTSKKQQALTGYNIAATQPKANPSASGIQTCNQCMIYWDRLLMWGDTTNPFQLYISDLQAPSYFPMGNTINFDTGKQESITALVRFSDMLYIFTQTTIQGLSGKSPSSFQRYLINDSMGCVAPLTARVINNYIIFLANEGVHQLVPNLFRPELGQIKRMDFPIRFKITQDSDACAWVQDAQYWLCYPSQSLIYRFYYDNGMWVQDTSGKLNIMQFYQYGSTVYNLTKDGNLYKHDRNTWTDNGEIYSMTAESKYFDMEASFNQKKLRRFYIIGKAGTTNTDLYVTVKADSVISLSPQPPGYAQITNGSVVWTVPQLEPNFTLYQNGVVGQAIVGSALTGTQDLGVQWASVHGKARRVKVTITHQEDSYCEVYGFGMEYKLKRANAR